MIIAKVIALVKDNNVFGLCLLGHPYHAEGITCLAISSDSSLALTGSKDGSVHILNLTTGRVFLNHSEHSQLFF